MKKKNTKSDVYRNPGFEAIKAPVKSGSGVKSDKVTSNRDLRAGRK